jgi:hypothetical protein
VWTDSDGMSEVHVIKHACFLSFAPSLDIASRMNLNPRFDDWLEVLELIGWGIQN